MSLTVFLDTGPLGIITNPKRPQETVDALAWTITMSRAGHRFVVPAVADYEVRRELKRLGRTGSIAALDAWNTVRPDRYLPLSDTALHLASTLWAQARNAGRPTADPKELDGDVLIVAQALDLGLPFIDLVIATTNVGHLSQFIRAELWMNIAP